MSEEISFEEILTTLEKWRINDYDFVKSLMECYLKGKYIGDLQRLLLGKIRRMVDTSKEVSFDEGMTILEQTTVLGELYQRLDKLCWPQIQIRPETFYENIVIQDKEDLVYFVETCLHNYQELFEEYGVSTHALNITRDIGEPLPILAYDFMYLMSFFSEADIILYLQEVYTEIAKHDYDKIVGLE